MKINQRSLWLINISLLISSAVSSHSLRYSNARFELQPRKENPADSSKAAVANIMQRVAAWQMHACAGQEKAFWTDAVMYIGMAEYGKATGDSSCLGWLKTVGTKLKWAQNLEINPFYRYHADDYAVGMMYSEMYRMYQDKKMYRPMENYLDFILMYPSKRSLKHTSEPHSICTERWTWCDALFMAPPVWAKMANITGKKTYLEFMDKEYRATYKHLYDKNNHLFYRDDEYFGKKEANGQPVFWGRGNGWVLAGLPMIIRELPADFKNKKFYETLFVQMAEKIAGLQGKDGYWRASLLDPDSYPSPETSCTGLYTYALAWGLNNGYLDKTKYGPIVSKAWKALTAAVNANGKLGWVQPVGADPRKVTADMTDVFGVGAFLLAGTEVMKIDGIGFNVGLEGNAFSKKKMMYCLAD
jgi:rhamnogalacturonyl hydrolase YesR